MTAKEATDRAAAKHLAAIEKAAEESAMINVALVMLNTPLIANCLPVSQKSELKKLIFPTPRH